MTTGQRTHEVNTVFLDRDGTINEKPPEGEYVTRWSEFEFLPRAPEAIRLLNRAEMAVVVVTNQRGIALGRMTQDDLTQVHERMHEALLARGARVDAVYHCPHDRGSCDCRKPAIGMLEQARRQLDGIDFASSALIGDSETDVEAARRAGALPIRIGGSPAPADGFAELTLWDASVRLVDARSR